MTPANTDAATGTPSYARLHKYGLTLPQQNAVDLLAAGKNDTETALALGLHRVTVTRWRLYDPLFQTALNRRRAELWGRACDRLRSLVPKALTALDRALESSCLTEQMKAAAVVLRLAQLPPAGAGIGPTDAEEAEEDLAERAGRRVDRVLAKLHRKPREAATERAILDSLSRADRLLAEPVTPEEAEAARREEEAGRLAALEESLTDEEARELERIDGLTADELEDELVAEEEERKWAARSASPEPPAPAPEGALTVGGTDGDRLSPKPP